MNINKLSVIKIGGSTINDWHKSIGQIYEIIKMGNSIVIVHGGGKTVSDWGAKLGPQTGNREQKLADLGIPEIWMLSNEIVVKAWRGSERVGGGSRFP